MCSTDLYFGRYTTLQLKRRKILLRSMSTDTYSSVFGSADCSRVQWSCDARQPRLFLQQFTKKFEIHPGARLKSWHKHQLMCVWSLFFLKDVCYRTIHLLDDCGENKPTSQYPNDGKHCESLFSDDPINKWIISFLNNLIQRLSHPYHNRLLFIAKYYK